MSDLMNIGLTGLRTSRNNLTVTGHNISNIDTPGYSRQRAVQITNPPFGTGAGYLGTGARTQTIQRIVDQFTINQVRVDTSRMKDNEAYLRNASELDNLLANENSALGTALNRFFEGVQSAANDPLSRPARELVFSQADSVSQRFKSAQARLSDQNNNINTQLRTYSSRVNELAVGIGEINREIKIYQGTQNQPPNDLFDRRDELLRQLSEIVEVDVFEQDALDINVFIGSGIPLIVGENVNKLEAVPGEFDKSRYDVNLVDARGNRVNINSSITGGSMGGVMRYRTDTLDPALNEMGRIALVFAGEFNNQHRGGIDLNGDQGGDFFRDINTPEFMLDRIPGLQRHAPAGVWLNPDALNRLPAGEFMIRETVNGLVLSEAPEGRRLGTFTDMAQMNTFLEQNYGFRVTDGQAGNPPADMNPAVFAQQLERGLLISPVRIGASQLERSPELSNTNKIALSGIAWDENNAGTARLRFDGLYSDAGAAGIQQPLNLDVLGLTGAEISVDPAAGNPPVAGDFILTGFPAGSTVTGYDNDGQLIIQLGAGPQELRMDVSGGARAGDSWVLEGRAGGKNATALGLLQQAKLIERQADGRGGASLGETYSMLVEKVGIRTSESRTATEVSQAVLNQSIAMRESTSGVNMDEEAANLIRFQQAYQASTQVIAAAQRMFDTLLSAVGR
ncbi:flagellar hook-associated protein FlgK [Marinospirillum alkaliphilum]|uniref:Flagellar hook-associated protein 1 n=1 Tax=Marinospirillum alkaliphilum DSM 21637 TaxID=1122209 RepID=A0A1K1UZU3_9GAMM|nr:flagellar hook-associated protein FlgK [Marinospirillum alkaliphilum]SFX18351.1 flagellar hook-associated protein 1 FlgK [Marinospirillum alkaliphilum DSM 21637]